MNKIILRKKKKNKGNQLDDAEIEEEYGEKE